MPVYLVGYAKRAVLRAANHFVRLETPKYNAFDLIDENFENSNSTSNNFQKHTISLVLTDSVIICIYWR